MRKQPRRPEHHPQHDAGRPTDNRQPCDNMPHVNRLVVHLDSSSFVLRDSLRKSLRITAFVLTAVLASTLPALAQAGRVAGRVLDQTGAVLAGVTIDLVVQRTERTTTTDHEGRYQFENVPAGTAELTFRLLNFSVVRRSLNTP